MNLTWSKSLSNLRFSKPLAKVVLSLSKNSRIKRFDKLWTFEPPVWDAPTVVLNDNKSGLVGVKASSYNPRISANYDTNSDNYHILKRKVYECISLVKSAGGTSSYNVLMKMLTDKDLTRPDLEFIEKNIGEIVKPEIGRASCRERV